MAPAHLHKRKARFIYAQTYLKPTRLAAVKILKTQASQRSRAANVKTTTAVGVAAGSVTAEIDVVESNICRRMPLNAI